MQDEKLINLTEKQDTKTIRLTSPRGTIFDKNQRALAISIKTPSIYIDPIMLDVSSEQIKKLKNILGITSSEWKAKTKDKSKRFVWLARKINPEIRHLINEMNIKGVGIIEEWDRLYPDREYASQVLGFVNLDGKGMEGVEKQYEQSLFSHAVELKSQKDAKGRPIFVGDNIDFERRKGFDVYLTIDSTLQYFLEDELTKAAQKNNVVSGFAIMMNPHTGQVLAMTSYPRMNPNRIDKSSAESRKNRNVLDTFEPGSTFKAFVMAQALEENIVKPDEILNCKEGTLWIAGRKIHNPVDKDWLTPEGIIKYSNNVCMAHIGMKLGQVGLRHVIDHFGFAQKTGIDFPYESAGIFDDTGTWRDMRIANLAFGQGISVTAIQMVRAMSVIANGGWLVQPYIVDSMVSGTGEQIDMSPRARRKKTFSPETMDLMKRYLHSVTSEEGTGKNARIGGYEIAGKTGTAQIYDAKEKAYSHKKVVSSFIGFAPVKDPKIVTYIVLYQPEGGEHGGTIAAPVFKASMEKALPYLEVYPQVLAMH